VTDPVATRKSSQNAINGFAPLPAGILRRFG
jgi:hypothetical protein